MPAVERIRLGCYNQQRSARFGIGAVFFGSPALHQREANSPVARGGRADFERGQVAQVVERSPEKAGVGGSTPSLATMIPKNLFELPGAAPVRSQSASERSVKRLKRMSIALKNLS